MARRTHRGRRSRGRFGFLYVVLSFLLILVCLVVGSVVFFRANTISVVGNDLYAADDIIAAAQVEEGQNLFRINRPATYQRILASLPYVRSVNIRRAFPDELVITVTETHAVAFLTCSDGIFLLDARGKVLEEVSTPPTTLPEISGLEPLPPVIGSLLPVEHHQKTRMDGLTGLLIALEDHGMVGNLRYIDLSSSSDLLFGYTERFTAQMPLVCDHNYKVRALDYVVQQLAANESGLIDLTRSDETHFIPQ